MGRGLIEPLDDLRDTNPATHPGLLDRLAVDFVEHGCRIRHTLRLIATSAVRCVGNTLLLQGRTYSPPFVITAVADASAVRDKLAASVQVGIFRQAVEAFGLTFDIRERPSVSLPAYDGSLALRYAAAV